MAIHESAPLLTYEDYLHFPDDGQRHEILGGEHFVTPAPFLQHQRLSFRLSYYIEAALRTNRVGEAFAAPTDVLLSPHDIVQPDLVFISRERIALVREKNIQGAPDLVIEILSASTRRLDEDLKLKAYERCGVAEYWLFDPTGETVRVWERRVGGLHIKAQLSAAAGDALTTPLVPGLEIPLAELFRR
jgi:Uma2 family endonuclease